MWRNPDSVRAAPVAYRVAMLLLVAATDRELCGHDGLVCGVGPVEAAAATARALALHPFDTVLHVGLAGGREGEGFSDGWRQWLSCALGRAAMTVRGPGDERERGEARGRRRADVVEEVLRRPAARRPGRQPRR